MTTTRYKSDVTYADAVGKYYAFSFVASCFTHIPLGLAGLAMGAQPIIMIMVMAVIQVGTWLIVANAMCLTLQSMVQANQNTSPTPPAPVEKITAVEGNAGITTIKRTYR